VRRAAADLTRTSTTLERALSRRQEQPAPFFGTVLSDQVDIAALDAVWCKGARADRPGVSVGAASVPQPAAPAPAALESTAPEPATPQPTAPDPTAPGTGTPELAAEIAPAGLEPVGLLMAGIAAAARVPAGFVPAGFVPVALDPAGLRPGGESAPQATPMSDPTVRTMAGLPAPMHDGRMEARAA
jgi:hypothetical protein